VECVEQPCVCGTSDENMFTTQNQYALTVITIDPVHHEGYRFDKVRKQRRENFRGSFHVKGCEKVTKMRTME
jgi:hypothetical protein